MNSQLYEKLLISVTTFLVCFLLIEIYFRAFQEPVNLLELTGKKTTENPMADWATNEPYFAYSALPGMYAGDKSVNSFHFISTPKLRLRKDSGVVRLVFLGESSTAGTGKNLADIETWPYKVVQNLKDLNYSVDYINAACGGYTTFNSYGILWSRLRFFSPDIIIINHGWNDFSYFHESKRQLINRRKNDQGIYEGIYFKGYYQYFKPLKIDAWIAWSQWLSRFRFIFFSEQGVGEIIYDNEFEDIEDELFYADQNGKDAFKENLWLINEYCKIKKIACFFCKQPTLITNKNIDFDDDLETNRIDFYRKEMDHFEAIYTIIDSLAQPHQIIDLTSVSGIEKYFWDHIHPSPEGTDIIASIVADSIRNNYFATANK